MTFYEAAFRAVDTVRKSLAYLHCNKITFRSVQMTKGIRTVSTLTDGAGRRWVMSTQDRQQPSFERPFMVVFQDAALMIAKDGDAPGPCARVYLWALTALSHETWRALRQVEIAGELDVSVSSVSQSLAHLATRGLLERRGSGPRQEWRLSPDGSWRGTAGAYHKARRDRATAKPQLRVVGRPREMAVTGAPDA